MWQFAANIGLEQAVNQTHENCENIHLPSYEREISAIEGIGKCEMKLNRPIPFRTGRVDCIPDEEAKWTPYGFEATKKERHSNAQGTGQQVVKDLKTDFNLTARETISLMSLHSLNAFGKNFELQRAYHWIGGIRDDRR